MAILVILCKPHSKGNVRAGRKGDQKLRAKPRCNDGDTKHGELEARTQEVILIIICYICLRS